MFTPVNLLLCSLFGLKGLIVRSSDAFNLTSTKGTPTVISDSNLIKQTTNSTGYITSVSEINQTQGHTEFNATVGYSSLNNDQSTTQTTETDRNVSEFGMYTNSSWKTRDSPTTTESPLAPSKTNSLNNDVSTLKDTTPSGNLENNLEEETNICKLPVTLSL